MIVDVHYHLIPKLAEGYPERIVGILLREAKITGKKIEREELIRRSAESIADPSGERVLSIMKDAGINFTAVCAVDSPLITEEQAMNTNQTIAKIAKKFPNRLIALAGVDPRRPNAPDMLTRCFEEFGMRGLKYHPDYGFDPTSPESYKLLSIVQNYDGILLTHTGPLPPPMRPQYSEPLLLADIGIDFPNLKVIAAHMGQPMNWRPWASLASHQPNLYGDLAMWAPFAFGHYNLFCRELRDLIDYAGIEKVLFGTDNPLYELIEPTKDWIQLIKDLPTKAPADITFTEEEVNAMLGDNATSLFGL